MPTVTPESAVSSRPDRRRMARTAHRAHGGRRIDDPDSTQHGTVNTAVTRRLARFGTGWIPWESALADLPTAISAMKDAVRERAETQPGCRSWSPPGSQTSECRSKFPSATTRRCSS